MTLDDVMAKLRFCLCDGTDEKALRAAIEQYAAEQVAVAEREFNPLAHVERAHGITAPASSRSSATATDTQDEAA